MWRAERTISFAAVVGVVAVSVSVDDVASATIAVRLPPIVKGLAFLPTPKRANGGLVAEVIIKLLSVSVFATVEIPLSSLRIMRSLACVWRL